MENLKPTEDSQNNKESSYKKTNKTTKVYSDVFHQLMNTTNHQNKLFAIRYCQIRIRALSNCIQMYVNAAAVQTNQEQIPYRKVINFLQKYKNKTKEKQLISNRQSVLNFLEDVKGKTTGHPTSQNIWLVNDVTSKLSRNVNKRKWFVLVHVKQNLFSCCTNIFNSF